MLGLLAGLVLGVGISLGFIWYFNRSNIPFQDKAPHEPAASVPGEGLPAPLPPKPGDKPLEKPRFDFYRILPQGQTGTPAPASGPDGTVPPVDRFYLQLGAFQKAADADNLKARLALMGLEAGVQDVTMEDKTVLHRVRTGPYERPEDMNRVRNQLAQNGIQATVVKSRETPLTAPDQKPADQKPAKQ